MLLDSARSNGFVPQQVIEDQPKVGALAKIASLVVRSTNAIAAIVLSDQGVANKPLIPRCDCVGAGFEETESTQDRIIAVVKAEDPLNMLGCESVFSGRR